MKSLLPVFLVLLFAVAHAQEDFWITVSKGSSLSKSSYVYASETESVLFDAGLQIQDAKDIVEALKSHVVNPFRTLTSVFVLSDTPTSYLGLQTIVHAFPNVTVWAAPNVAASILKKYKSDIPQVVAAGYKNINNQIPKINQLTGNSFTVGNTKFEVYEFEGVSSPWTSTVWVPSQRSLLTGDLFSNGVFPQLAFAAAENSFDKWRVTLTELSSTYSPISVLYPGFGAVVKTATGAAFDAARKFLEDFRTAIQPPNTLAEALELLKVKYASWTEVANLQRALEVALPASICSLNCRGKTCGDDGCGGCCGVCEEPFSCNEYGQCECVPQCNGTHCGADGCGGTCSSCKYGTCQSDGTCACTPVCSEGFCGNDGCGGSCGCDTGYICNGEGKCVEPEGNVVDLHFNFAGLVNFDCTTSPDCKL